MNFLYLECRVSFSFFFHHSRINILQGMRNSRVGLENNFVCKSHGTFAKNVWNFLINPNLNDREKILRTFLRSLLWFFAKLDVVTIGTRLWESQKSHIRFTFASLVKHQRHLVITFLKEQQASLLDFTCSRSICYTFIIPEACMRYLETI